MRIKNLLCKLRGGETAANRSRTRRSLTSASGNLFVEAAIIAPIAFVGLMGGVEIMNIYVQRGSVINVANSIAMAIQQNPDITAQEMYEFQKSLGGGVTPFKEVNISDGSPYTGTTPCSAKDCRVTGLDIRIGASTTPVQEQNIRNLAPSDWSSPYVGKLPGQANPAWPNAVSPLQVDPNQSTADDAKAFYVGVRVAWQNRPIITRLGFASVTTTQFAGVVVKQTVSMQCPGGQTVTGISADGSAICASVPGPELCRTVSNVGGPPHFVSTVSCGPGERLTNVTVQCEVPGSGICASKSKGVLHSYFLGDSSASADCFSYNWIGEACSRVMGQCCRPA